MSFAGHADWRLPNVKELMSIVNYENVAPTVSSAFNNGCTPGCMVTTCSCTQPSNYWSSTTTAAAPQGRAHLLDVNRGEPVAVGGPHGLSLWVGMRYRIIRAEGARGPWKVKTAGYAYAIDDRDGHEVLAYHCAWTPVSVAEVHAGLRPWEEFVIPDLVRVLPCLPTRTTFSRCSGSATAAGCACGPSPRRIASPLRSRGRSASRRAGDAGDRPAQRRRRPSEGT